ncbi:MAG: hypothetical protein NT062_38730 [Proteobacteria bacterium]|nr:hypothetical protein [Pseudomonadota bacterium]
MTTQPQSHTLSLSIELAHPDEERRQSAQRWQAALHRLCLLRATMNETAYEIEWARMFVNEQLMGDLQHRSKLLALAAIDVLEVQQEHALIVCQADEIEYDNRAAEETLVLLDVMREKIEKGLP